MSTKVKKFNNIEELNILFLEREYQLLDDEYINSRTKMRYRCLKHSEKELAITYARFRSGQGCPYCARAATRVPIEEVRKKFESRGYELLEDEYTSNKIKMRYRCPKHPDKELSMAYDKLQKGKGCPYCAGVAKYTIEFVREKFDERGYDLLESIYINSNTKMNYKCRIHPDKILTITFNKLFRQGNGCPYCAKNKKYTIEEVSTIFSDKGYQLLDTNYVNCETSLKYKCFKHPDKDTRTSVNNLLNGVQCPYCAAEAKESKGSKKVRDFLEINNIKYKSEYTFKHLVGEKGRSLRFDFAIFNNVGNDVCCLIEYDGHHHFQPMRFSSSVSEALAQKRYEKTQFYDKMKNQYAKEHSIPLIRISYKEDSDSVKSILSDFLSTV